jgi:hypothetical protein
MPFSRRTAAAAAWLCAGLAATATAVDAKTLIHAGRLIDGTSDTVRTSVTVVVDGDRNV